MEPTPILATLVAALAALIIGVSLGRRLIRWLLKEPLAETAERIHTHHQYLEFCDPRAPTSQWCCLATSASPPQPAYLPKEDRDGADRDIPPRFPRAEVRQHLEEYGIDVLKVAKRFPPLERYGVERVAVVTSYLAGLGVDVKRVVEVRPTLLGGSVEKYEPVVGLLRANGVDVADAATRNPSVLTRRVETLQHTMAAIAHCGHSVAAVVRSQPVILRAPPTGISAMLQLHSLATPLEDGSAAQPLEPAEPMVALFSSVGLDAGLLLKKAPGAFNFSVGYLRAAVANLERIGVDVPKVLRFAPTVLSLLPETLQRVVQFLSENGLDPVYHINKFPSLLALSVEHKLRPTLTFVMEEMGRSKAELRKVPSLWGYSLEGRLRPRFQYLESLGVSHFFLSSFTCYSDKTFAESLADTDLGHYYAWRLANGYPVPPRWLSASAVAPPPLAEGDDNSAV